MTGRPAPAAPPAREEPPAKPSKPAAEVKGDDFDNVFGSGKPEKTEKAAPAAEQPKRGATVYVPPAPGGGGDLKESLSIADVQEVVLANKPAIAKCVEDQRKKEPGVKGTLLMKWTILTSGKVSNVSVQTEELKGSYMAGCVGPLIKGLTFPRHKTQGEPITFPFKF